MKPPICPYCKNDAKLVSGDSVYWHRQDLGYLKFWKCGPCDAWVGCHKKNKNPYSDGTRPLGRLADRTLRQMKQKVHAALDPYWKDKTYKNLYSRQARNQVYQRLSEDMSLKLEDTHIGMFSVEQCRDAIHIIKSWDNE